MAMTIATYDSSTGGVQAASPIQSASITVAINDILICMAEVEDYGAAPVGPPTNTSTSLTWNQVFLSNQSNQCALGIWWAKSTANMTTVVSCTWTSGSRSAIMTVAVHTGAHVTNPCPAGNVFFGYKNVSAYQSITPSNTGSALWMLCGDWAASNEYTAGTNCSLENTVNAATFFTGTIGKPTTQPRTDNATFTISVLGNTTPTQTNMAWCAFEVQVADSTAPTVTAFTVTSPQFGLTATISSFTATDNVAVYGYMVNESASAPAANDGRWQLTAPSSYTFNSYGAKTLYAWAKDQAGNVSSSVSQSVTMTGASLAWNHI